MTDALGGVKVVEAATLFAAPFAGMLLADFGAEVVKLEHPRRPDPAGRTQHGNCSRSPSGTGRLNRGATILFG